MTLVDALPRANQPDPPPSKPVSPRVTGATAGASLAGAATIVISTLVKQIWKVELPVEFWQAITMILSGFGAYAGGWARKADD
jgi:hypothetical protein